MYYSCFKIFYPEPAGAQKNLLIQSLSAGHKKAMVVGHGFFYKEYFNLVKEIPYTKLHLPAGENAGAIREAIHCRNLVRYILVRERVSWCFTISA